VEPRRERGDVSEVEAQWCEGGRATGWVRQCERGGGAAA
jgi:hypothetical protein